MERKWETNNTGFQLELSKLQEDGLLMALPLAVLEDKHEFTVGDKDLSVTVESKTALNVENVVAQNANSGINITKNSEGAYE